MTHDSTKHQTDHGAFAASDLAGRRTRERPDERGRTRLLRRQDMASVAAHRISPSPPSSRSHRTPSRLGVARRPRTPAPPKRAGRRSSPSSQRCHAG